MRDDNMAVRWWLGDTNSGKAFSVILIKKNDRVREEAANSHYIVTKSERERVRQCLHILLFFALNSRLLRLCVYRDVA